MLIKEYFFIDVPCPIPECTYSTGPVPETIAVALLNTHALIHTPGQANAGTLSRTVGPKLDRPRVSMGISLEKWNMFESVKSGSNIDDSVAAPHLFQCSDGDLGDALLKVDANITTQPFERVPSHYESS